MPVKKTVVKKVAPKKVSGLSVPVYSLTGRASGTMSLPKEIFGVKVNKKLLSQMVRIYLNNRKTLPGSTKTRGQVEGSTAKIYRQKGTGRARHGSIRANLFVGGGIVFGPTPRKVILDFPKKMKKAALANALSKQFHAGNIMVVDGLEELPAKTKVFAKAIHAVGKSGKTLVVIPSDAKNVFRGARNIEDVDIISATDLNTYAVLSHTNVIITKTALPIISKTVHA